MTWTEATREIEALRAMVRDYRRLCRALRRGDAVAMARAQASLERQGERGIRRDHGR